MVKLKPITDKSWLVLTDDSLESRVGLLTKGLDKYILMARAAKTEFRNKEEIAEFFNCNIFNNLVEVEDKPEDKEYFIKGYPVDFNDPHEVEGTHDLPLYGKTETSSIYYAAGYYCLGFPKGWVHSFCPKHSTLTKYKYRGPFRTEGEMRHILKKMKVEYVRDKQIQAQGTEC